MLAEGIGVGALSGNQKNVAGLDIGTEIAVPPDVMRRAKRPQDITGMLDQIGAG